MARRWWSAPRMRRKGTRSPHARDATANLDPTLRRSVANDVVLGVLWISEVNRRLKDDPSTIHISVRQAESPIQVRPQLGQPAWELLPALAVRLALLLLGRTLAIHGVGDRQQTAATFGVARESTATWRRGCSGSWSHCQVKASD